MTSEASFELTLPVELYTPEREREFDAGEAELAEVLARPCAAAPAWPKRKPAR